MENCEARADGSEWINLLEIKFCYFPMSALHLNGEDGD